jgi:hypothetical protein
MNLSEAPFYSGRTLRSLLPLLIVPLLADVARAGGPARCGGFFRDDRPRSEGDGYLATIGGPGLRFTAPAPESEPATRPVVPVLPAAPPTAGAATPASPGGETRMSEPREPKPVAKPAVAPAAKSPPPPILPDDLRPQVRPEDFLPFFQPPGSSAGAVPAGVPVPPPPGALPPSSATFMQTTR